MENNQPTNSMRSCLTLHTKALKEFVLELHRDEKQELDVPNVVPVIYLEKVFKIMDIIRLVDSSQSYL